MRSKSHLILRRKKWINEPTRQPIAEAMPTYLRFSVRAAMLTQAGHIRPSPLRGSPRGLSKPATSLRRFSRLRTPYGLSRPGAMGGGATRMIRAFSPPLFRSWRLPFSRAKLAYISLNTQTPCPPRGACPCGTNLIKNPVWMRHARDDVSARVAVFPPESNPAFSNPAGLPALLRRGRS